MVTVPAKVMHDPIAPSIPSFLFQKPKNKSAPKIHSETPKNQLAPRTLKTSYNQKISGPLLMQGYQHLSFIFPPFLIAKKEEYDHHRRPYEMIVQVFGEKTGLRQDLNERIHCFHSILSPMHCGPSTTLALCFSLRRRAETLLYWRWRCLWLRAWAFSRT
jgi:hypothetical protein